MDDDALDATFFALSSSLRRRMLDVLLREPGCNVNRVCEWFAGEVGRFAVMKHLAALERGGLLVAARQGRERRLWCDPTPIQLIHERWTTEYSAYWAARLTRLKYAAEGAQVHAWPRARKGAAAGAPSGEAAAAVGPPSSGRAAPAAGATTPAQPKRRRRHG